MSTYRKYFTGIDMQQNPIMNMSIKGLFSAPSNPVEGQVYYHR